MKRYTTKLIQILPTEILITIFEFLSPKDLANCSLVCKQWYSLASSDEIWSKLYRKYHINLPINHIKTDYLKRSKEHLRNLLSKHRNSRRIHHLFPSFDYISKLELSLVAEIVGEKGKVLLKHGQPLSGKELECVSGVMLSFQKKIECNRFPPMGHIEAVRIFLSIPCFIKNLVPTRDAIRIPLNLSTIPLSKEIKSIRNYECQCKDLFQYITFAKAGDVIEWHVCINRFLLGLWTSDRSIAYFSYHISIMEILLNMEKYIALENIKVRFSIPVTIKEPGNKHNKLCLTKSETDLKCMLFVGNIEPSSILLLNVWRSIDYTQGCPTTLIEKSNDANHVKLKTNIEFKPSIGHLHVNFQNFVKVKIDIVTPRNDPLWSHSSCVVLSPVSNTTDWRIT